MHDRHEPQTLEKRVIVLERAVFGYIDDETRMIVPGILQNTADTKRSVDSMERGENAAAVRGKRDRQRIFRAVLGVGLLAGGNLLHVVAPGLWNAIHILFGSHF